MWIASCCVVVTAILLGLVIQASEQPVIPLTLGEGGYDMQPVVAPVASGTLLEALSLALCSDWVGPLLCRILLNGNGLHEIRSLGAQAHGPAVFIPLVRLTPDEHAKHVAAAKDSNVLDIVQRRPGDARRGVVELHNAYRAGAWAPVQELQRALDAARTVGKELRCFVELLEATAMEEAKASELRWNAGKPLGVFDGVPFVVKDEVAVGGTVLGEGLLRQRPPEDADDSIVRRLREAGGVLIGKTVMTTLGMDPLGYNDLYQGPFNPYNRSHFSGGSSAGTAVAVGAGIVPVGLGLDGGGSIRLPAAFSGAYGLAPTTARVPFSKGDSVLASVIKIGPIAADVGSLAAVYQIIAPPDPTHEYTAMYGHPGPPPPQFSGVAEVGSLAGVRLGIFTPHFEDASPLVVAACRKAADVLIAAGATVVEVKIPHLKNLALAHGLTIGSEMGAGHETDWWSNRHMFSAAPKISLGIFRAFSAKEYVAAMRLKGWALQWMQDEVFSKVDVYFSPVASTTAPRIPTEALAAGISDTALVMRVMRFIFLGNFLGHPAISCPLGYEEDTGLPLSAHMMAKHWDEALLLRLGYALQSSSAFGAWKPPPSA